MILRFSVTVLDAVLSPQFVRALSSSHLYRKQSLLPVSYTHLDVYKRQVPTLEPGASDAQFLNPAGIPTYGVTGLFTDPDGGHIHGLNERIRISSVYEGRTFLYRLVKLYADQ